MFNDLICKAMTSTETKITFETLPKAVEEIKVELVHLKGTVERLLELSSGTQRDSWMNIDQLRAYHPDHPAKSTIYEWVGQSRIPVHKDGKKLRFLKSEIDEWLCGGRNKTQEEIEREATEYLQRRKGGLR